MKKLIFAVLWLLAPVGVTTAPLPDIEIVESIPTGTTLDNPDIRNTLAVWLEMVGGARKTLDIEQFYISDEPGKMLEPVLAAVSSAAARGVKVRVLVDARMYKTYPASADRLAAVPNIEVRRIDFSSFAGGPQHAKYFIVDGREVFVGSQNFDWRALEHIHELGLRIRDPQFSTAYRDIFDLDWRLASMATEAARDFTPEKKKYLTPIRITEAGGGMAALVPTFSPLKYVPDDTLWDEKAIVELIDGARRTLTLQFLSYSPGNRQGGKYTAIDGAMRRAAARGVRVRMLVSDWQKGTDAVPALKELAALPNIEVAFSVIPEWQGGYIPFARVEHCKYIVADEARFWLGTSNCEKSYYYSSRNLGVVCASQALATRLAKIFLKSWDSSYREPITLNGQYPPREHGEKKVQ